MEIWKDIKGYERYYQISNMGRIKSISRYIITRNRFKIHKRHIKEIILKPSPTYGNYLGCSLCKKEKKTLTIHRLVAQAFIPNPENKTEINHKNGIKSDNRLSNLEWVTSSENTIDAYLNGLMVDNSGKNNPSARAIIQMDKMDNIIKRFDYIKEAGEELGINRSLICGACRRRHGHNMAGGFKWRYDDLEIPEA